jgi:hypothetical protein
VKSGNDACFDQAAQPYLTGSFRQTDHVGEARYRDAAILRQDGEDLAIVHIQFDF